MASIPEMVLRVSTAALWRQGVHRRAPQHISPRVCAECCLNYNTEQRCNLLLLLITFAVQMLISESRYLHYSATAREEAPFYIFDKRFADKNPEMAQDYSVPLYFDEDLFSLLGLLGVVKKAFYMVLLVYFRCCDFLLLKLMFFRRRSSARPPLDHHRSEEEWVKLSH